MRSVCGFLILIILAFPPAIEAETYHRYVDKLDGANGPTQGTGPGEDAWKDFAYAVHAIANDVGHTYTWDDIVTLHLANGPFHLGREWAILGNDYVPVRYDPFGDADGIPYLSIIGEDGGQEITGLNDAQQLRGWSNPSGDIWTNDWAFTAFDDDERYNFGFGTLPSDYEEPEPGDHFDEWVHDVLEVLPDVDSWGARDQFGVYLLRREMLVVLDDSGQEFLVHRPKEVYGEFVEEEANYNTFYASYYNDITSQTTIGDLDITRPISDWTLTFQTQLDLSDTADIKIYVPVVGTLFAAQRAPGVKLQDLSFRYSTTQFQSLQYAAVNLKWCGQVTVSDCSFEYISSVGLNINHCPATYDGDNGWTLNGDAPPGYNRIRNVVARECGIYGMSLNQCVAFDLMGCTLEYNNWRGAQAGTMDFAVGACKLFQVHKVRVFDLITNHNYGYGFWFDQDCQDITINNITAEYNQNSGLFLEASPGPFYVNGGSISHNSLWPGNIPGITEMGRKNGGLTLRTHL